MPSRFGDANPAVKASATHGVVHVVASNGTIDKTTSLLAKFVESHNELEAYKSESLLLAYRISALLTSF